MMGDEVRGHHQGGTRLGLDWDELAEAVGVSINTVRTMEACGSEPVGGLASTRDKVREALEGMGIEFLNGSPSEWFARGAVSCWP